MATILDDVRHDIGRRFGETAARFAGYTQKESTMEALQTALCLTAKEMLYEGVILEAGALKYRLESGGMHLAFTYRPPFPFEYQTTSWFYPYREDK